MGRRRKSLVSSLCLFLPAVADRKSDFHCTSFFLILCVSVCVCTRPSASSLLWLHSYSYIIRRRETGVAFQQQKISLSPQESEWKEQMNLQLLLFFFWFLLRNRFAFLIPFVHHLLISLFPVSPALHSHHHHSSESRSLSSGFSLSSQVDDESHEPAVRPLVLSYSGWEDFCCPFVSFLPFCKQKSQLHAAVPLLLCCGKHFIFFLVSISLFRLTVAFRSQFRSLSVLSHLLWAKGRNRLLTESQQIVENHLICSSDCRVVISSFRRREKREREENSYLELENRYTCEGDRLVERVSRTLLHTCVTWDVREKYRLLLLLLLLLLCLTKRRWCRWSKSQALLCLIIWEPSPLLLLLLRLIIIYSPFFSN